MEPNEKEDKDFENLEREDEEEKEWEDDDDQEQDEDKDSQELEKLKKENESLKVQKSKYKDKFEELSKQPKPEAPDLSSSDLYALMSNKVAEEDVDIVKKIAKLEYNGSIKEALQDEDLKTILKGREERRDTADAMNTNSKRKSVKSVTDSEVMENANKGVMPEKGSKEADQLFWARRGGKPS